MRMSLRPDMSISAIHTRLVVRKDSFQKLSLSTHREDSGSEYETFCCAFDKYKYHYGWNKDASVEGRAHAIPGRRPQRTGMSQPT